MARVGTQQRNQSPISPRSVGRVSPVLFLQEVISELRKSVWPSKEETARLTAIVIALAVVVGFFLGGLDRVFAELFNRGIFAVFRLF
ncbi:MAG: preprotein translocase subunit SecE [Chloroflexota bacterium]|nr:preprotein translocase subunit SecE [Chloroflexota bacterium]